MKNICKGAALVGVFFVFVTGCVSGPVNDKRAHGVPGEKTFQILVDDRTQMDSKKTWVTVPESVWDACHLEDQYPDCAEGKRQSER